jgi:hypothetical protein
MNKHKVIDKRLLFNVACSGFGVFGASDLYYRELSGAEGFQVNSAQRARTQHSLLFIYTDLWSRRLRHLPPDRGLLDVFDDLTGTVLT